MNDMQNAEMMCEKRCGGQESNRYAYFYKQDVV